MTRLGVKVDFNMENRGKRFDEADVLKADGSELHVADASELEAGNSELHGADDSELHEADEAELSEADEAELSGTDLSPVREEQTAEPEYIPKNRYERLLWHVYKNDTLAEMLKIASYAIVLLTVYAFFARIVGLIETPMEIVKLLTVTGVPFVLVSILRRVINAPRPYELLEFYEKKPKGKSGRSFPSRHVFSVFVIATVLVTWNPTVAVLLFSAGALLALLRVALGIHFVRDVVAGALIGAASGGIGLAVLHLI